MSKYSPIQLTSSGGTIDPYIGFGSLQDLLIYSASPLVMAASLSISPTVTEISLGGFKVRWTAVISNLNGFTVNICGKNISADQVNQTGTFDCYYDGSSWSVFYYADGTEQPQSAPGVDLVTVPVGGTLTLIAGDSKSNQRLSGAPTTLTSNYTVTAGTSGVKPGARFDVEVVGGVTLSGNTMTVFGISINADQALNGGVSIIAIYDGSTWNGVSTSKPVTPADLGNIPVASVLGNDTGSPAPPTSVQLSSDGHVLKRSGGFLVSDFLSKINFGSSIIAIEQTTKNISALELSSGFTSPIPVVSAPGIGLATIPLFAYARCTYVSATYTTNLDCMLIHAGASIPLVERKLLLGFSTSMGALMTPHDAISASSQIVANANVNFQVVGGDPLVGDGTISLTIFYLTVTA